MKIRNSTFILVAVALAAVVGFAIAFVVAIAVSRDRVSDLPVRAAMETPVSGGNVVYGPSTFRGPIYIVEGSNLGVYDTSLTQVFGIDGANGALGQALNVENLGGLPSIAYTSVTTTTTGAVFTVADGEIWYIVDVFYHVTTNFDCTGDDCTLDLGDGNDADGLLDCADANLQTTFTDFTGAQAGWGGLDGSAPKGAYLVGGQFIYAPSGASETIDIAIGGTSPAAGEATIYIVYYRMQ